MSARKKLQVIQTPSPTDENKFVIEIFDTVPDGVTQGDWIAFQQAWNECPVGKWAKITLLDNSPRHSVLYSLRAYVHDHAHGQGRILSDRTSENVLWIQKKG